MISHLKSAIEVVKVDRLCQGFGISRSSESNDLPTSYEDDKLHIEDRRQHVKNTQHTPLTMLGLRAARTFTPAVRRITQRRLESSLSGPADNAFNRERQAVKEHAAATSGTCFSLYEHR